MGTFLAPIYCIAAASTGGLFGAPAQKSDSTEKKDAPAGNVPHSFFSECLAFIRETAAPAFNLFGSKDASSEKKDTAARQLTHMLSAVMPN